MKTIYLISVFTLILLLAIFGCERYNPFEPVSEEGAVPVGKAAGANRWIVVFEPGTFVNEPAKEAILKRFDAVEIKDLPLVNGAAVILPPAAAPALGRVSGVIRVDPDIVVHIIKGKPSKPPGQGKPKNEEPQPPQSLPWGIDRIDAELVWSTDNGNGVNIAILDTGIDLDHPDLIGNIGGGINIINSRKSANDDNGHGTHVAGTVAAVNNEIGVVGVAPDAKLYAVKAFDRKGNGFLSDIIAGIGWSITNGMQVINMSFGADSDVQSLHDAITAAYDAGITMVAAAGNNGSYVLYPAKYTETIAVSATAEGDILASFSSVGPEIDLAAPGVAILSTWKGGGYNTIDGTSMAAPHVTGTVALVLEDNLSQTPNEVKNILLTTADDLGLSLDQQGNGLVDAERQ